MTKFNKFYKKTLLERLDVLENLGDITLLRNNQTLSLDTANTIIENCIGLYGVPLGIAPEFIIDGNTYHAPMATEEPSVIAAASFAAKIIAKSGGFTVEQNDRGMIGQIAFPNVTNIDNATKIILEHQNDILQRANNAYPSIVKRGGGARKIWVEHKTSTDKTNLFLIVYLEVDTQEAMGANMLNTMLEAICPYIAKLIQQNALLSILSNYATQSIVRVTCTIKPEHLQAGNTTLSATDLVQKIALAYQFASADIYRATTHNKGVMNGISAVVLATGNDTRAIESGVHAYSSQTGTYQPITKWEVLNTGELKGTIEVPLPVGFVGGSISIHPTAKISQLLSQTTNAKELAALIASVGLAQNLAALRALVSDGIQKGHMALQLKSLALSVGATSNEVDTVVEQLKQSAIVNQDTAQQILNNLRNL